MTIPRGCRCTAMDFISELKIISLPTLTLLKNLLFDLCDKNLTLLEQQGAVSD